MVRKLRLCPRTVYGSVRADILNGLGGTIMFFEMSNHKELHTHNLLIGGLVKLGEFDPRWVPFKLAIVH